MLKKRKTPLHVLFGEREALRNNPIKINNSNGRAGNIEPIKPAYGLKIQRDKK